MEFKDVKNAIDAYNYIKEKWTSSSVYKKFFKNHPCFAKLIEITVLLLVLSFTPIISNEIYHNMHIYLGLGSDFDYSFPNLQGKYQSNKTFSIQLHVIDNYDNRDVNVYITDIPLGDNRKFLEFNYSTNSVKVDSSKGVKEITMATFGASQKHKICVFIEALYPEGFFNNIEKLNDCRDVITIIE